MDAFIHLFFKRKLYINFIYSDIWKFPILIFVIWIFQISMTTIFKLEIETSGNQRKAYQAARRIAIMQEHGVCCEHINFIGFAWFGLLILTSHHSKAFYYQYIFDVEWEKIEWKDALPRIFFMPLSKNKRESLRCLIHNSFTFSLLFNSFTLSIHSLKEHFQQ